MLRDFLAYAASAGLRAARARRRVARPRSRTLRRDRTGPGARPAAGRLRRAGCARRGLVVHEDFGSAASRIDLAVEDPRPPRPGAARRRDRRARAMPRCAAPATATGCVPSSSAGSAGSTCGCGRPTCSATRPATWPGWSPRPTVPQRSLGPGRRHRAQTRPRRDQRPRSAGRAAAEPAEDTAEDTAEETAKGTDEGTAESRAEDAHAEPAGADRGDEARKRRLVRRRPKVAPEQTRDDTDAGWGEYADTSAHDRWLQEQRPPHWGTD